MGVGAVGSAGTKKATDGSATTSSTKLGTGNVLGYSTGINQ